MKMGFLDDDFECYATLKREICHKGQRLPAGTQVEVIKTKDPERTVVYFRGLDDLPYGHFSFWARRDVLLYNQ